ncbi:MAG: type 1 glutamine amidotransferase domain-containing protein [Brumimicrobium sp.]|nr:type 1 glutamine amidotransferase domain-containing protein [Brumimicrobium sp.]
MTKLKNKRVAILATNGFEESELVSPMQALRDRGVEVHIISEDTGEIKAWKEGNWSKAYKVDKAVKEVSAEDYHGLVLPGGVMNPDKLRRNGQAVTFVRDFFKQHKPVAAICHAGWMLAEADVLKGRKITSFPGIRTDMENAGANWVDEAVVVDQGLVTSRTPADLDAFNAKVVEEVAEGKHEMQTV